MGDTIELSSGVAAAMNIGTINYIGVAVMMDFNSNGNFYDAGEYLYHDYQSLSNYVYSFNITPPSNLPTGYYRMRVIGVWFADPNTASTYACYNQGTTYGSWFDYTVHVVGSTCNPGITTQPLPATRCIGGGDTMTIDALGSNFIYQWKFNGVDIPNATSSKLIFNNIDTPNAGSYTCLVSSTICNQGGTLTNAAVLTVNTRPVIYNGGPTTFCPGSNVTLTSSATSGNQWTLNGSPIFNATNQTYVANAPGIYTVIYTNNCPSPSRPDTIANYPAPSPVISPSGNSGVLRICFGSTQVITTNTAPNLTYQWKNNGNTITGANGASYTVTTSGNYLSRYKMLYANSSDPGSTFQWRLNGNDIPNATNSIYTAYNPGVYTVISFNGCYVTSNPTTLSTLTFPTLTTSGPTSFCFGGNVVLNSSITDTAGIHYQWLHDGVSINAANSTTYTATDSGTYQLLLVIDSACTTTSGIETVNVLPAPQPIILTTGPNGYTLNTTLYYTSYQWYWGTSLANMAAVTGANLYNFDVITTGFYSVKVADNNNCNATSTPIFVNVVTNTTGINPVIAGDLIKIYPNPASAVLHVSSPVKVNLTLSGVDGRTIMQQNDAADVNISSLASGIYFIKVCDKAGQVLKTEKLIKN